MEKSNKLLKFIIVIAIVFILIGAVFCGAAYAFGGMYVDSKLDNDNSSYASPSVSKIEISDGVANIKLLKSSDDNGEISVKAENILLEYYKCEISGGALKISYNPDKYKFGFISFPSFFFERNMKSPEINVYIPAGKVLDEIYFKSGVGNISIEEINAESFIIGGGVGNYDIKNMTAGSLRINGGVGDVRFSGIINGGTVIDGGLGNLNISGQANGDIRLKGGVGNVNLNLTGDINDYNIKVDSGVGNIRINGKKTSEFTNSSGSKYNIDVDGGLGNINIDIK